VDFVWTFIFYLIQDYLVHNQLETFLCGVLYSYE